MGIKNGNRQYKLEVTPGVNIGTYHIIDSNKVSLFYAGQQQTCGRCHQVAKKCKGGGIARKCEVQGGQKIEFQDYIVDLWNSIGYSPENGDLQVIENELEVDQVDHFTPVRMQTFPLEKFGGVSIKQFPLDSDQGAIVEFLCNN